MTHRQFAHQCYDTPNSPYVRAQVDALLRAHGIETRALALRKTEKRETADEIREALRSIGITTNGSN